MPTKEGFDPADPLPRFLADRAGQDIGNALDETAPRSGIFKTSILIVSVTAIGIAVLAAGDPVALFAWGAALLAGNSPRSTPTIQSAADQVLPPAAKDAPARGEIAASEPAGAGQTENRELPSETLKHFQAWAAEREAQARGEPAPPAQDSPAQIVQNTPVPNAPAPNAPAQSVPAQNTPAQNAPAQNAPAASAEHVRVPNRFVQKRRQVRSVRDARAELRTQNLRRQVRRAERARVERPPEQDAQAQDTSAQNAPPLPYYFGLGNQ